MAQFVAESGIGEWCEARGFPLEPLEPDETVYPMAYGYPVDPAWLARTTVEFINVYTKVGRLAETKEGRRRLIADHTMQDPSVRNIAAALRVSQVVQSFEDNGQLAVVGAYKLMATYAFLLTTASDEDDFAFLHVPCMEELYHYLDEAGVARWLTRQGHPLVRD